MDGLSDDGPGIYTLLRGGGTAGSENGAHECLGTLVTQDQFLVVAVYLTRARLIRGTLEGDKGPPHPVTARFHSRVDYPNGRCAALRRPLQTPLRNAPRDIGGSDVQFPRSSA